MGRFDPYADNGGTTLAISGENFCIVASDTRQSDGYSINSRMSSKLFVINNSAVLGITGFHADGQRLFKSIMAHVEDYRQNNGVDPDIHAIAHLLSYILYSKRFFPYYTFPILSGVDSSGTLNDTKIVGSGVVYSYDPVGSFEREPHRVSGSSSALIQPFLDSQILGKNSKLPLAKITAADALDLATTAFKSAAERDIYTGDTLEVIVLTPGKLSKECVALRRD